MVEWGVRCLEIENLVQNGDGTGARARIRRLDLPKVPRRYAARLASAIRRAGLPLVALRLLAAIVRPGERRAGGTDAERAVYAGTLAWIGAADEALRWLKNIDGNKTPEAFLYRSSALVSRWEYEEAIPVLEAFLARTQADPVQQVIGNLNLLAALVHERRLAEAEPLLRHLETATLKLSLPRFYGNTLELGAQWAIEGKRWPAAEDYLEKAAAQLKSVGNLDYFFVEKWRALLNLRRVADESARQGTLAVRQRAIELRHWETVRDCDLALGLATNDRALLLHVYFGTPYEAFRRRIFRDVANPIKLPDVYARAMGPEAPDGPRAGRARVSFDFLTRDASASSLPKTLLRLLRILSSDFYRPMRTAVIHARLYPGDFFDAASSTARVYQSIWLLRRWLAQNKLPLAVRAVENTYFLESRIPILWHVPRQASLTAADEHNPLESLRRNRPEGFDIHEAVAGMERPRRTVVRLLRAAIEDGELERIGGGPNAWYRFRKAA